MPTDKTPALAGARVKLSWRAAVYHRQMWTKLVSVLVGLASVGSVTALVSKSAQRITVPELHLVTEACDPSPAFKVVEDPYDSIKATTRGWTWRAQGYIEMHPCQGGTLTLNGYGVEAGGGWPVLIAGLDTEGLGSWIFDQERNLTLTVPYGGRLILAFNNAYYNAENRPIQQRQLHLTKVRFTPRQ